MITAMLVNSEDNNLDGPKQDRLVVARTQLTVTLQQFSPGLERVKTVQEIQVSRVTELTIQARINMIKWATVKVSKNQMLLG